MKLYRIHFAIVVLLLASLACQTVAGGPGDSPTAQSGSETSGPEVLQPTPSEFNGNESLPTTDFPMTPDAYNVTEAGGSLIFYTKLSLEDAMQFYRDTYTSRGYTEREILTVVSEGNFSIVFDGDPSGQAVVIQSGPRRWKPDDRHPAGRCLIPKGSQCHCQSCNSCLVLTGLQYQNAKSTFQMDSGSLDNGRDLSPLCAHAFRASPFCRGGCDHQKSRSYDRVRSAGGVVLARAGFKS